jgi:hypothetical protein
MGDVISTIRRATAHAVTRPDGLDGPMRAVGRGRDVLDAATLREVQIEARAGFDDGRIAALRCDDPDLDLTPLVGTSAFSGFRAAATELLADERGSVVQQLLDDLPVAFLLSGRVLRAEGIALGAPGRTPPVDICAGWVRGGSLLAGFTDDGPPLHMGPPATRLRGDGPPEPSSTTRRRRIDVRLDGGVARVEAWFRDTYVDGAGAETVVHQYEVLTSVDRASRTFLRAGAVPGPLPYVECPGAASSAERLAGLPIDGLRDRVSADFTGPSTCTHLNDALRSLEGVDHLLTTLESMMNTTKEQR